MNRRGRKRWDHEVIYDLIPEGATVLDLGCGDGDLLHKLIKNRKVQGLGIEKDFDRVAQTIQKAVPVLNMNLDEGLAGLPDKFFDFVVLEKTLQAVGKPLFVLKEMLRVGRAGIVSFPNFGHWHVIASLISTGRMPVTSTLPYQWYDTPNIHLFTAKDFLDWVRDNKVKVIKGLSWVNGGIIPFIEEDVGFAEEVLFVVSAQD
jgi:methionine biosynthesis protein MetW